MCRYFNGFSLRSGIKSLSGNSASLLSPCTYLYSSRKCLLDDLRVDLPTEVDTLLELSLVVRLFTLRFDVLLDGVDLRFVHDQLLLDVIQSIVDVILQDEVLGGVMAHGVVGRLLGDPELVLGHKHSDYL